MSENNNLDHATFQELLNIGRAQGAVVQDKGMNIPVVVIPQDHKVVPLDPQIYNKYAAHPHRVEANVAVRDAASFAEYYRLFSDPNSRVFAEADKNYILAILDYHGALSDGAPRWGSHRLRLVLQESVEWLLWSGKNGENMTQSEFATFLEDNSYDIAEPASATMLEVATDMHASIEGDFGSAIRLANGSVNFKYSETVRASVGAGQMQVPERFKIAIPLFLGGERIAFECRLRYRINAGKLTFWYDMLRNETIKLAGFRFVVENLSKDLSITIINGSPAA